MGSEVETSISEAKAAPLSFLDQIKAKNGGGGGVSRPAMPSFLDQIKSRQQAAAASEETAMVTPLKTGKLNFLDAIKSRRIDNDE